MKKARTQVAAEGGKARAAKLTPEQKSEIARKAASARWNADVPTPKCEGEIPFGDMFVPCAVLEDETRLLSERGVTKGFGLKRAGSNWQGKEGSARMPVFASAKNLEPFISSDLRSALIEPIKYRPLNAKGSVAYGFRAELLPDICEVWLNARDANVLKSQQAHVAVAADLIIRGLSRVGIIALVDEATGYQSERERDALAKILEEFVTDELRKWVKTFPLSYFKELCRIRKVEFRSDMRLPPYFGHLTNDIIYSRLAPCVLTELRKRNPKIKGTRKHKHFQYLTDDVGVPSLKDHLTSVVTIMKLSNDWNDFHQKLDSVHRVWTPQQFLPGME
ncbi:P63C domain-containing protein [Neorhodopirellula lusitana]|uniref:P63C domain-containing protein n=1 Tax=Neorhodopirellula lusitana TaxID=445327 RepID=A0ABY1QC29_9BACT|nr:P63C domain-containing protein [Neorhodopirellula lusitana]SMP67043.1 P63C domain-containing protein [Neorhodopirellula lusitana]